MQAMHTFGSNKIFAASDFFTYQASAQLHLLSTARYESCSLHLPHFTLRTRNVVRLQLLERMAEIDSGETESLLIFTQACVLCRHA